MIDSRVRLQQRTLAHNVAQIARKRADMAQHVKIPRGKRAEVAEAAGIAAGYLSQVLRGYRRPALDVAIRIALAIRDVCGIDVSVEEIVRPAEPWPDDIRWLSSDPPADSAFGRRLADERESRRMAIAAEVSIPSARGKAAA